jgi:phosphatidylethanolamine/phosphatidyl-N-methylethanolamine N-methyltransferase
LACKGDPKNDKQGLVMNLEAIEKAYRRYAHSYDHIFGPVLHPGRKAVVDALDCQPGQRVLEVGVGTGLSLPLYPDYVDVVGIDISEDMLEQARQRVREMELYHVSSVLRMDAENMSLEADMFDIVVAMYVVSVVSDPLRLVEEMKRVCRPGGKIVIVNHFRSKRKVIAGMETLISPLSKYIGFRPNLNLESFLLRAGLDVIEERRTNAFGYWTILTCRNGSPEAALAA